MDKIFSPCQLQEDLDSSKTVETVSTKRLAMLHEDPVINTPMGYTFSDMDFVEKHFEMFKNGYAAVPCVPQLIKLYHSYTNTGIHESDRSRLPLGLRLLMERFRYLFHSLANEFGIS